LGDAPVSEANDPRFWDHVKLVELADKCRRDLERVRAAASGWKPNRDCFERPRERLHVQFAVSGSTYVGQRYADGWRDVIWGKNFTDEEVTHWALLLGSPET
jgi:hypothetical protein